MVRRLVSSLPLLLLLPFVLALSACTREEAELVDRAFAQEIRSAQIVLRLEAREGGKTQGIRISGPVASMGKDRLGKFDLRLQGFGRNFRGFTGRAISNGRRASIRFAGETYEVTGRQLRQFEREVAQSDDGPSDLAGLERLGLDPLSWFSTSTTADARSADGEPTTRVTGTLDLVTTLLELRRLSASPPFADNPAFKDLRNLKRSEMEDLTELVTEPTVEVDVAKSDGSLRRLSASAGFEVPGEEATMRFLLVLRDVGEPVSIPTPRRGKPISRLFSAWVAG